MDSFRRVGHENQIIINESACKNYHDSVLNLNQLFHLAGELNFSPIGMSAVMKLAPKKLVG